MAQQLRAQKQQQLKDELHQQIVELTARETRQNQLKNEERSLMQEQAELHLQRQLQIAKEKKEKQNNYQQILYRQYRAQILRRAHEIERELEEDLAAGMSMTQKRHSSLITRHDECSKNGSSLVTGHDDLPQKRLVTRQLVMTTF